MLQFDAHAVSHAHILGIDPGSETMGVAILTFDVRTYQIVKTTAATFWGSKLQGRQWIEDVHTARQRRIDAHRANLLSLLHAYHPVAVVSESPFFQMTRPQAYGALTETITGIRAALMGYSAYLPLHVIDPPSVKNAVGAKGNAKKEAVHTAILELQSVLQYSGPIALSALDEHSIDALAVAYGYFRSL